MNLDNIQVIGNLLAYPNISTLTQEKKMEKCVGSCMPSNTINHPEKNKEIIIYVSNTNYAQHENIKKIIFKFPPKTKSF